MKMADLPATALQLTAVVYVRQSTLAQVQENLESQRRQYALANVARGHGFRKVQVVDDDMGISASGTAARPGFERLVAMLCAGQVGAVFCLEASRLARNGRDWHHLLDLCGLVGAFVADGEGIYDPRQPNDRLLLGMKGTISEFELGTLRTRMLEARWSKAERGELRVAVPIGFMWERGSEARLDPDIRLQEVIHAVFAKFRELGSARQVLLWMSEREIHFPRPSDGRRTTSFEWRPIRYRNVISVLKNPFYAGAYVYGRRTHRTQIVNGRARKTYGCRELPMVEWPVLIKDHHEGYIAWEEFEANQELLARNTFGKRGGAAKSGRGGGALLSGLLRCRRCGHALNVSYSGQNHAPRYRCGARTVHVGPRCMQFAAWAVDRVIQREVLRATQPLAVEAAMEAERQVGRARDEVRRLHELELQQAQYEARLAERRYAACDPDNRLVAAQLEQRWEECLYRVAGLEQRLQDDTLASETAQEVERNLANLGANLEAAWNAPDTTMRTRQRLVRALIEEIIVDVDDDAGELVVTIHWKGGHHSEARTQKPRAGGAHRRTPEEAIDVIRSMVGRWPDEQIAASLNRMGFRTGTGKTWTASRVQSARAKRKIRAPTSSDQVEWLTMTAAAKRLGVSNHIIRRLISTNVLPAEQPVPRAPYRIRDADLFGDEVARALELYSRKDPGRTTDEERNLRIPGT